MTQKATADDDTGIFSQASLMTTKSSAEACARIFHGIEGEMKAASKQLWGRKRQSAVKSSSLDMSNGSGLSTAWLGCFEIRHGRSQRNFDVDTTSYNLGICTERVDYEKCSRLGGRD